MPDLQVPIQYASQTKPGLARIATIGEVYNGNNSGPFVSPFMLRAGLGFSRVFVSQEQAIVSGGNITLAHNLGNRPIFWCIKLRCLIAENGALAGEEYAIDYQQKIGVRPTNEGYLKADSTNIYFKYPTDILEVGDANGDYFLVTPANWRLIIVAWG